MGGLLRQVVVLAIVVVLVAIVRPETFDEAQAFFEKARDGFANGKAKVDCARDQGADPSLVQCRSASADGNTTTSPPANGTADGTP